MDYLKEFQAFAGRLSSAAEDRLTSIDGGTYNEFIRFYSQSWPTQAGANNEQRQMDVLLSTLLEELEDHALLSAPPGTVLHTSATENGVASALSKLSTALESCLFFVGRDGDGMPDFWRVLVWVNGEDHPAVATVVGAAVSEKDSNDGGDAAGVLGEAGTKGAAIARLEDQEPMETVGVGAPEPLTATVDRLTRVHTGHGRCRAWARGLLGLDGASAEWELRRAAEAAATDKGAADASTRQKAEGEGGEPPIGSACDLSDPDAGGGGGSKNAREARVATPAADDGDSLSAPTSSALPLWLRPGPQGASILEDLCRFVREFSSRLEERGLSVRPSLDHAWLDQENIAAATTYNWPRFPREQLRCYVWGAGLSAANGKYSPAERGEGGGLTLVGPNDCQIYRRVCRTVVDQTAPAGSSTATVGEHSDIAVADTENGAVEEITGVPAATETGSVAPATDAQLWCLAVPATHGTGRRNVYYCLGDGGLPPSRGWRAKDATDMPAPVLGFATQTDGEVDTGGEYLTKADAEEQAAEAAFAEAVVAVPDDTMTATSAARSGEDELSSASAPPSAKIYGSVTAQSAGRSVLRRKRRRPPELAVICGSVKADITKNCTADASHDGGYYEGVSAGDDGVGGVVSCAWPSTSDVYRVADCDAVRAGTCAPDEGDDVDGDEAVAAFKGERWKLPSPSGELRLRAERTRALLRRTSEERGVLLAARQGQLLPKVAAAEVEYQEVLQESMDATVARLLAARPELQKEAEAEVAEEAQRAIAIAQNGRPEREVHSLEDLVAEKAEELRTRPDRRPHEETRPRSSSRNESGDRETARLQAILLPAASLDVGWPWLADWLSAPLMPLNEAELHGLEGDVDSGGFTGMEEEAEPGDGDRADVPPVAIEVAAVEVADIEDPDAAHIEYVLRAVYREVRKTQDAPIGMPSTSATTAAEAVAVAAESTEGRFGHHPTMATDDPGETELRTLSTASKGLLQRTRVLSKRLNSLCALHPQLMWELEKGRRLRPGGFEPMEETLAFPDPFELGTLEESILRVHRDKLTPRFKANPPTRKLSMRIGSYLSGLLQFLGVLQVTGHADIRARMSRALNDALSICDRAGRKRRRGDFVLSVRVRDIAGGKLGSGAGDEGRPRVQKRRCMGCGRAIAAEFLGMKKDYFPCRFANGLFCRSYCHNEDRRVIPHRVVHHWDFTRHRVCKDSATFLDATRFVPVINLPKECPRLFVEHQALRLVRSRRTQLHYLRRAILFPAERKCTSGAQILEDLLEGRMHMAVDPGLYSLEDLLMVKRGSLLDILEETIEALLAHVMDECETCEARSARVCEVCYTGDPIFTFQIGTMARCPSCDSVFHIKCAAGQGQRKTSAAGTKWWADQSEADSGFVCPQCNAVAPMADATGEW